MISINLFGTTIAAILVSCWLLLRWLLLRTWRTGWRCFFCGEFFVDPIDAKIHFGEVGCEFDVPACVSPLRTDEQLRFKELWEAREHAAKMQAESEKNDECEWLLQSYRDEIGRLFGECGGVLASTPHQAWLKMEEQIGLKEAVYSERNKLVCALSKIFPASLERHPDSDPTWETDWRWIVFIDIPVRRYLACGDHNSGHGRHLLDEVKQVSWHIHDSEIGMFDHLPRNAGRVWDGHDTDEKYLRLSSLHISSGLQFLQYSDTKE